MTAYDVIVLGGGPAGEHCADLLAEGGLRVAVVERELVGGECTFWACRPSKTLLRPGEAVRAAREAAATAVVDVGAVLAWRDRVVSDYSDAGQERWLADRGIDLLRGRGRLAGPCAMEVDGVRHTTGHTVIATGSVPVIPPIRGLRTLDGLWTTRDATALQAVPRRLLVLGGGPAGVELAQAIRRLGAEVVLIERAERVLPHEAEPLGVAVAQQLRRDGIELRFGARITGAWRDGGECVLADEAGDELRGDRVLVAAGRRPRVNKIGLESLRMVPDARGVPVDARMRAAALVWAIGDVTGVWPMTHVAKYQARIAAADILGEPRDADYSAVPRVVFTDPQAAAVGVVEDRLRATAPLRALTKTATYSRAGSDGFLTLLSDGERLTGAHAFGPDAGEWVQQATLAIRARVPIDVLADTIQPFPTFSEVYVRALRVLRAASIASVVS